MSAGAFVDSRYELNNGQVAKIRVQPETLSLTLGTTENTAPTGAIDFPVSARVSGSKSRGIGLRARTVTVEWTGTPPAGYLPGGEITLPWLQIGSFLDLEPNVTTGSYLGAAVRVVRTNQQKIA